MATEESELKKEEDNGQWLCPKCQSFNPMDFENCIVCNLEDNNDDKYIFLDGDLFEFNKCQSISEEFSLICSYLFVIITIGLAILCTVLGVQHKSFMLVLFMAILALFITLGLLYLYNKHLPKIRQKNLSAQQIVLNGQDNKFTIINPNETIIFNCYHLERFGEKIFECGLTDIQNVDCSLNENNENIFTIYYYNKKEKSDDIQVFDHQYFFATLEWTRRIKYALNNAKQWNI